MRSSLLAILLLAAVHQVGEAAGEKRPSEKPAVSAIRPPVPSWHDRFEMPWAIEPAKIPFAAADCRQQLLRFDRIARTMAGREWPVRAGATYPYLNWNSGSSGYNRTYQAMWKSEDQDVVLSTTLYAKSRKAYGFDLRAVNRSSVGWTARVSFSCGVSVPNQYAVDAPQIYTEFFTLNLVHPDLLPQPKTRGSRSGLGTALNRPQFQVSRRDNNYSYRFNVDDGRSLAMRSSRKAHIQPYWDSASTFRTAALDELDRLEQRVRKNFASKNAVAVWTLGGPTGADPPQPTLSSNVPDSVLREVLKQAMQEISTRKLLIDEHFTEMHAAAVAAFPMLAKIVDEKASHSSTSEK